MTEHQQAVVIAPLEHLAKARYHWIMTVEVSPDGGYSRQVATRDGCMEYVTSRAEALKQITDLMRQALGIGGDVPLVILFFSLEQNQMAGLSGIVGGQDCGAR